MAPNDPTARRDVSLTRRRLLATTGAATAGVLAGCSGGGDNGGAGGDETTDDDDGGDSPESQLPSGSAGPDQRVSAVPGRANGLVYVDYQQFRTDEDLKRLLDSGVQSGTDVDSVESALESEGLQGIDPAKVYDMLVFTEIPENDPMAGASSYGGAVVWTGLASSDVVSALTSASDTELTEETHNGQTILLGESAEGSVGVVGEGVYVVGTEQVVRDTIDTAAGSGEAVSGTVTDALADTAESPLRFAADLPTGTFTSDGGGGATGAVQYTSEIDVVSGSFFYTTGDEVGFRVNATMSSEEIARQTEQALGSFEQAYRRRAEQMEEGGERLERMLDNLSISREGATVSVSYEDTVDNLIALGEDGVPVGGGGMGG